jgi:hypothetical protein
MPIWRRTAMLLVELGATALGLVLLIYSLGGRADWIADVTRHGDYVAILLGVDIVAALYLAVRVEWERSLRYASVVLHFGLVFVFLAAEILWHLDVFPD